MLRKDRCMLQAPHASDNDLQKKAVYLNGFRTRLKFAKCRHIFYNEAVVKLYFLKMDSEFLLLRKMSFV